MGRRRLGAVIASRGREVVTNLQTRKLTLSESRNSLATMVPESAARGAESLKGRSWQCEKEFKTAVGRLPGSQPILEGEAGLFDAVYGVCLRKGK